jgi:outer membrane protein assembly factor BamB
VWRDDSLKRRSLSAPAVVGEYVTVADLDGYVHWFDRATGSPAARIKTGGDRVTNAPLSIDGNLYVISDKGDIVALHGSPLAARAAAVEPAPAPAAAPGG